MNLFTRFGNWLENRRVLRKPDYERLIKICHEAFTEEGKDIRKDVEVEISGLKHSIVALVARISAMEEANKQPQEFVKELKLLNLRLNQLELFVGLKREPKAVHIRGEAKIQ